MALTDNCDIYAAINEAGINRVVGHVMRQRPSLFNYGTATFLSRPDLLCRSIDPHPVVLARHNPLITVEPPIPIIGTNGMYALDFCAQLPKADIDFSPGNVITLPPELNPPLPDQRLALHATLCAGLGCPSDDLVAKLPPALPPADKALSRGDQPFPRPERERPPLVLPPQTLHCFCLDLFAVAGATITGAPGDQHLLAQLMGLEIVDIKPVGLENSIECYAKLFLKLVLLPRLSVPPLLFAQDLLGLATITLTPSPVPAKVPNNPALEEDQLKVFIDLVVAGPPPPPGPPAPPGPPPLVGAVRPRVRVGPADGVVALSASAVGVLFEALRDRFTFSKSDSGSFGPFTLGYTVAAHLEDGTIELRNDGTIRVRELDVKWDALEVCFGIDIPEICVGGFCLIPKPWAPWECLVEAPTICAFGASPDLSFCLDIGGFVTSEISATVAPLTKYAVNPGRLPGMNDWDARDAGVPNKWQILVDPQTIDLDVFDIADMVGDLFENAVDAAIDGLLGFLPDWANDLVRAMLGPVVDLMRTILDFGDDFEEWLSDQLGVSLGLFNFLVTAVADYFAAGRPLIEIDDPVQFMGPEGALIPVLLPVEYLGVGVNAAELTLNADLGG